ncbi:MAG TPA: beta-ketoacyl-ACP synthase II [Thermoanaerobaculia bacterium]|nr:beta-ketoacyl-ACP synthase II [Thermoanaerobaculia bacterium]
MDKRRVVVTGIGMISPLGIGKEPTWRGLIEGRSGVGPITRFDCREFACRIAGEVKGFDPVDWVEKKEVKKSDIFIHFAIAAAQTAVDDAAIEMPRPNRDRAGVIIASGIGGFTSIQDTHKILLERGPGRVSPFFIPGAIINLAAGLVSIRFGLEGPSSAPATACAAGAHAIGDAFKIIQRDDADVMIAGGAEAAVTPLSVGGFAAMRALSTRNDNPQAASRPWDLQRDGFVIGEGAGVLVLEELGHAVRRGARIYCELTGYGMTSDAHHITAPAEDGSGMVRVMDRALRDAGLQPSDIGYINAHGTSTPVGDRTETVAVKRVFGERARKVAISSTKSMTGHLLGAAGGLESGIAALALVEGILPPTINQETPDPDNDLDYIPNVARRQQVQHVLSNSFGFGGMNATLIFSRYE